MKKLPPMVRVTWRDACTYNDHYDNLKGHPLTARAVSVGFLAHKGRHEIHLTQNIWENGNQCAVIAIPRQWIDRIELLGRSGVGKEWE